MLRRLISFLVCFCLLFEQSGLAQVAGELNISGYFASLHSQVFTEKFRPLHLRCLSYDNTNDNFKLLLDKGDVKNSQTADLKDTAKTLLDYFLIGVSLPNNAFWVNLRPDKEDHILDNDLEKTDIGRILLEADLQLKKDTARFTSIELLEGKEYWDKLYKKAGELFATDRIIIPTLTRPWIVPNEIIIRETKDNAYIYKATLKVLLEQDYLKNSSVYNFKDPRLKVLNEYSSELIRKLIIPRLTKEVNTSKKYAPLRQVYYSLILSQWFKSKFQGKSGAYAKRIDKKDLSNLISEIPWSKKTYFEEYQKSFREGEYNIKTPSYGPYGQTIRSYFSGGIELAIKDWGVSSSPVTIIQGNSRTQEVLERDKVIFDLRSNGEATLVEGAPSSIGLSAVNQESPKTGAPFNNYSSSSPVNEVGSIKDNETGGIITELKNVWSLVKEYKWFTVILLAVSLACLHPDVLYNLRPLSPTFYLHEFAHGNYTVGNIDIPGWAKSFVQRPYFTPIEFLGHTFNKLGGAVFGSIAGLMGGALANDIWRQISDILLPDVVDVAIGIALFKFSLKQTRPLVKFGLLCASFGYFLFHSAYLINDIFHLNSIAPAGAGDYSVTSEAWDLPYLNSTASMILGSVFILSAGYTITQAGSLFMYALKSIKAFFTPATLSTGSSRSLLSRISRILISSAVAGGLMFISVSVLYSRYDTKVKKLTTPQIVRHIQSGKSSYLRYIDYSELADRKQFDTLRDMLLESQGKDEDLISVLESESRGISVPFTKHVLDNMSTLSASERALLLRLAGEFPLEQAVPYFVDILNKEKDPNVLTVVIDKVNFFFNEDILRAKLAAASKVKNSTANKELKAKMGKAEKEISDELKDALEWKAQERKEKSYKEGIKKKPASGIVGHIKRHTTCEFRRLDFEELVRRGEFEILRDLLLNDKNNATAKTMLAEHSQEVSLFFARYLSENREKLDSRRRKLIFMVAIRAPVREAIPYLIDSIVKENDPVVLYEAAGSHGIAYKSYESGLFKVQIEALDRAIKISEDAKFKADALELKRYLEEIHKSPASSPVNSFIVDDNSASSPMEQSAIEVGDIIINNISTTEREVLSIEGNILVVKRTGRDGSSAIQRIRLEQILDALDDGIVRIEKAQAKINPAKVNMGNDAVAVALREKLKALKSNNFTTYHRLLKLLGSSIGLKSSQGNDLLDIRGPLDNRDEAIILSGIDSKISPVNINHDALERFIFSYDLNPEAYFPVKDLLIRLFEEAYQAQKIEIGRDSAPYVFNLSEGGSFVLEILGIRLVFELKNNVLNFQRIGGSLRQVMDGSERRYQIQSLGVDISVGFSSGKVTIKNNLNQPLEIEAAKRADVKAATKSIDIDTEVTQKTLNAVLTREQELMSALSGQEAFPDLEYMRAFPEVARQERALLSRIFLKIIADADSPASSELRSVLMRDLDFSPDRADEVLKIILEGRIDELDSGLSLTERKKIYEAIFTRARIWRTPSGGFDTLTNFISLNSGIKEKYFGILGFTKIDISFGESTADFAQEVIRRKEAIRGYPLSESEKRENREKYSSGRIGGTSIFFRNTDGRAGCKIVINLGVDGFGKVLSSIFHESAHHILNDISRRQINSYDAAFIHEAVAEDFAIFAIGELGKMYDGDSVFSVLLARRQARVMKEKINLAKYRYGFLLIETIRNRIGMDNFHATMIREIARVAKGASSIKMMSEVADNLSSSPAIGIKNWLRGIITQGSLLRAGKAKEKDLLERRMYADTAEMVKVLDPLLHVEKTKSDERIQRILPEVYGYLSQRQDQMNYDVQEAALVNERNLSIPEHIIKRGLGRKLLGFEKADIHTFQDLGGISREEFQRLAEIVQMIDRLGLLPYVRCAFLYHDVSKVGSLDILREWQGIGGIDFRIPNKASALILRNLKSSVGQGVGLFENIALFKNNPKAQLLNELFYRILETRGSAGQWIRGEVTYDAFVAFTDWIRENLDQLAEIMGCPGDNGLAARRISDLIYLFNFLDASSIREDLMNSSLNRQLSGVFDDVCRVITKESGAFKDDWQDISMKYYGGLNTPQSHRKYLKDRLGRFRTERRVFGETKEELDSLVDSLSDKAVAVLANDLRNFQGWYIESATFGLSVESQLKLIAIALALAKKNGLDTTKPFHVTFFDLLRLLASGRQKFDYYKTRILETVLNQASLQEIILNSEVLSRFGKEASTGDKEHPVLGVIEIDPLDGQKAVSLDFSFTKEALNLLGLLYEYEKRDSVAFHAILKDLLDIYGIRKDEFDRANNEVLYLNTMDAASNDKARLLQYGKGSVWVDVGPGDGPTLEIAEKLKSAKGIKQVVAIEKSHVAFEALQKRIATKHLSAKAIEADAASMPEVLKSLGISQADTIIFCAMLHEVYSYAEKDGRRFNLDTVKDLLRSALIGLSLGGRILIRDGVIPDNGDEPQVLELTGKNNKEVFDYYVNNFEGRDLSSAYKIISEDRDREIWKIQMLRKDAMEFLFTLTWCYRPEFNTSSLPYEIREQYGVLTRSGYIQMLGDIARELGFGIKEIPLPASEQAYLQQGYIDNLKGRARLLDLDGKKVSLPASNMMIVVEKTSSSPIKTTVASLASSSPAATPSVIGQPAKSGALITSSLPTDLIGEGADLRAQDWDSITNYLIAAARQGLVNEVYVDIDNTLFKPRGYLGSERQKETSVRKLAMRELLAKGKEPSDADLALAIEMASGFTFLRAKRDEERMIESRFFETAGKLTPGHIETLRRSGVRIIGLTARPKENEDVTRDILKSVGISNEHIGEIIFTNGSGNAKAAFLEQELKKMGVDKEKVVFIDDLVVNTAPVREKLGITTIQLDEEDSNYTQLDWEDFLELAQKELREGLSTEGAETRAFEHLVNAYALATRGRTEYVKERAIELLSARLRNQFLETITGLRDIVSPFDFGPKGSYGISIKQLKESLYLLYEIDVLMDSIKAKFGPRITEEGLERIRETALLVMDIHSDQRRKGGDRPYFVHQLAVTRELIENFDILYSDPATIIQIALLHDTREDQEEEYDDLKLYMREQALRRLKPEKAAGADELERFAFIRLGVRILSKLSGEKYEKKYPDKAEREKEYLRRLASPRSAYNEPADGIDYVDYGEDFIHDIQAIKASDRLKNLGDLGSLIVDGVFVYQNERGFPEKTFNKTLGDFIDIFIRGSRLTQNERLRFYDSAKSILIGYAGQDTLKRGEENILREAAIRAAKKLEEKREDILASSPVVSLQGEALQEVRTGVSSPIGENDLTSNGSVPIVSGANHSRSARILAAFLNIPQEMILDDNLSLIIDRDFSEQENSEKQYNLLDEKGAIRGFVHIIAAEDGIELNLGVSDELQGTGIGKTILAKLRSVMKGEGIAFVGQENGYLAHNKTSFEALGLGPILIKSDSLKLYLPKNDNSNESKIVSSPVGPTIKFEDDNTVEALGTRYKTIGDFGPEYPEVKKAESIENGKVIVIKPLRPHSGEEKFCSLIINPYIVSGLVVLDASSKKFFLSPYIKGDALEHFAQRTDIPLRDKLKSFIKIISNLSDALTYLQTLGLGYVDKKLNEHFIIEEDSGELRIIDLGILIEQKDRKILLRNNMGLFIDVVNLLNSSLPNGLRIKFEKELSIVREDISREKFKSFEELSGILKNILSGLMEEVVSEPSNIKASPEIGTAASPVLGVPEQIFMVIPGKYFAIATTLPSPITGIPWDFTADKEQAKEDEIILVFKNNGHARGIDTKGALRGLDFDKKPELTQVIYKGQTFSLDEFRRRSGSLFKGILDLYGAVAFRGEYVYRAIDRVEWREIQEKGVFVVRDKTNFEENIGHQVEYYVNEDDYAGIIIRIPVEGPYFMRAGFQVPRISSIVPHFAKPEILVSKIGEPEKWVSVEEYLETKNKKQEGLSGEKDKDNVSSPVKQDVGGIDLRSLPANIQNTNATGFTLSEIPALNPINIDLDKELLQIQTMINAEVIPSSERIKEYLQAVCQKEELDKRADQVLVCILGILRLEEDNVVPTEPILKDLLNMLESENPPKNLQLALAKY